MVCIGKVNVRKGQNVRRSFMLYICPMRSIIFILFFAKLISAEKLKIDTMGVPLEERQRVCDKFYYDTKLKLPFCLPFCKSTESEYVGTKRENGPCDLKIQITVNAMKRKPAACKFFLAELGKCIPECKLSCSTTVI